MTRVRITTRDNRKCNFENVRFKSLLCERAVALPVHDIQKHHRGTDCETYKVFAVNLKFVTMLHQKGQLLLGALGN